MPTQTAKPCPSEPVDISIPGSLMPDWDGPAAGCPSFRRVGQFLLSENSLVPPEPRTGPERHAPSISTNLSLPFISGILWVNVHLTEIQGCHNIRRSSKRTARMPGTGAYVPLLITSTRIRDAISSYSLKSMFSSNFLQILLVDQRLISISIISGKEPSAKSKSRVPLRVILLHPHFNGFPANWQFPN